jgi:hypothetical protein
MPSWLVALLRLLVDRHIMSAGPPPNDISDLIGVVDAGRPTDIATDRDAMLAGAIIRFR